MGCSFLYFMNSIGLIDRFFETTAEKLLLTRKESVCLANLSTKGFLPAAKIKQLRTDKLIESIPEVTKTSVDDSVDVSVRPTVANFRRMKLKFLITEDQNMRRRLKGTGVKVISTVDVIAHMAKKKVITANDAVHAIEALRTFHWYDNKVLDAVIERVGR